MSDVWFRLWLPVADERTISRITPSQTSKSNIWCVTIYRQPRTIPKRALSVSLKLTIPQKGTQNNGHYVNDLGVITVQHY